MDEITTTSNPNKDHPFLNLANLGKTHWGIYLLSLFVIGFIWLFGSVILIALFVGEAFFSDQITKGTLNPFAEFMGLILTFIALLIGLWVGVCRLHRRPFWSLITPYTHFRSTRFWQGIKWQFLFIFLVALIEELIYPGTYQYTLDPTQFYKFAILVIIFIPLQATSEELLFRGYILQALGHLTQKPIVLVIINGLGFMGLHFANPEIGHGLPAWLTYFSWGVFLTILTLKDNGAELAIGIHVANNVCAGIFLNYKESALPTNAVFTAQEIHAWFELVAYVLSAIVLYWIFFQNYTPASIPQPIQEINESNAETVTSAPQEKSSDEP